MMEEQRREDQKEGERRLSEMHRTILGLAVKKDVTDLKNLIVDDRGALKLATKEDVDQILLVFKNIKTAATILSGTGSWAWRFLVGFAMFIAMILFISGHVKIAIGYLIDHALGG